MAQNEQDRIDESVGESVSAAAEDVAAALGDEAAEVRLAKDSADESAGEEAHLVDKRVGAIPQAQLQEWLASNGVRLS